MNLKELRQEVNAALDYNPDLAQYRDIVARVLNRHYLQISSQYQWSFLQKTHEITLKAKIEGGTGKTITVSDSGNGRRSVSFGGVSAPSAESSWEGQTLKIGTVETEITRVVSTSEVIIDTTLIADISASTDWSLEFRKYAVPKDCTEILGIMSRDDDRGRLVYVDKAREEHLHLDRDQTGDGIVYISMDSYIDPPPDDAPSVSSAVGGSLEKSTEYEFCYTFIYKGRESAPSLTASVTTGTSTDRSVKVFDLEDTQATYGSGLGTANSTGRLKRVYARKKTSGGVWREISGDIEESTTSFTWDGSFSSSSSGAQEKQRIPTLFEQGPRDYFRVWYTPASDMNMDVRYLQQPRRLSNDAEVPSWPAPYHHLLVYRTLQDICLQHGMTQLGPLYERRAGAVLEQMKARWLSSPDRMYIRGSFMKDVFQFERWGTPSKL